jgi:hypothetical protein
MAKCAAKNCQEKAVYFAVVYGRTYAEEWKLPACKVHEQRMAGGQSDYWDMSKARKG